MRTLPLLLRPEQQADKAHADSRTDGEGHHEVSALRHAFFHPQHTGEAHAEMHGSHKIQTVRQGACHVYRQQPGPVHGEEGVQRKQRVPWHLLVGQPSHEQGHLLCPKAVGGAFLQGDWDDDLKDQNSLSRTLVTNSLMSLSLSDNNVKASYFFM